MNVVILTQCDLEIVIEQKVAQLCLIIITGDDDAFITDTEDKIGSMPTIPSSDQVYHIIRQSMASQLLPGMSYIHSIPKKGASQVKSILRKYLQL